MKKKKLLKKIQYLESKVRELQTTDTQIYQRLEGIYQIMAYGAQSPSIRKRARL